MPSIMRSINIIGRCAAAYRADHLLGHELTACHHAYVLSICTHPGISQEALARHICINKSNVTRTLAFLEEKGYVLRRQSENDKRMILVYPTEKMQEVFPLVKRIAGDWNAYLAADLSEEEREGFMRTLEKISLQAQKYLDTKEEKGKENPS